MFKNAKKIIALLMCLFMILPVIAACGAKGEGVVVSSTEFNALFNPVFARTAYDVAIADRVNIGIYKYDRYAELESYACEYKKPEEFTGDDGNTWVKYTFTLKDGLIFSDGKPVTADDIIFTYKLYLDPAYDGSATLSNVPILGAKEYLSDEPDLALSEKALEKAEKTAYEKAEANITEQDKVQWVYDDEGMTGAVTKDNVVKYLVDTYGEDYGFTEEIAIAYINEDIAGEVIELLATKYLSEYWATELAGGAKVPDIAGITKIDEKTVEVIVTAVTPTAEMQLSISILPKHYYGKNFKKGYLSKVKELNGKPLGAGPYIFESFKNNVVSLKANKDYFEGEPEIKRLVYQVVDMGNEYDVVKDGSVDIADPSAKPEIIKQADEDGLHYELIDNLGYGYIGVSAKMTPDKNIRKALMCLMNRGPAVETYYGELAVIIERPISMVSWAYPQGATAYYQYSKDKALEYFAAAGYTQEGGKLVKNGEQYSVNLYISDDTHPVVPVFTQMKTDLESLGARCDILQLDWGVYSEKYSAGECDVWAAAWQATPDPDMTQTYHSKMIATNNNPYNINNAELDKLIDEGVRTIDKNKRKDIYSKALDIVMDEAVEMPFYQRKNMYVIQQAHVDIESLPENMTPYYEWAAEIHTLRTVALAEAK
jgi:peptide/nickel transport system substrate-binding protein